MTPANFHGFLSSGAKRSYLWDANGPAEDAEEALSMPMLLSDILLFSCLAAFITGIVIAVASLLS